ITVPNNHAHPLPTRRSSHLHATPAAETTRSFSATMPGGQEVPPTPSPGTGTASATLDPDGTLHWTVSYQNLSGPATAAHFHGPTSEEHTPELQSRGQLACRP